MSALVPKTPFQQNWVSPLPKRLGPLVLIQKSELLGAPSYTFAPHNLGMLQLTRATHYDLRPSLPRILPCSTLIYAFSARPEFVQTHDALNKAEVVHPRSSFPLNGLWSLDLRVSRPLGSRLYLKALGWLCRDPAGREAAPKC